MLCASLGRFKVLCLMHYGTSIVGQSARFLVIYDVQIR